MQCEEHNTVNDVMVNVHMCASEFLRNYILVYPVLFSNVSPHRFFRWNVMYVFAKDSVFLVETQVFNNTTFHLVIRL